MMVVATRTCTALAAVIVIMTQTQQPCWAFVTLHQRSININHRRIKFPQQPLPSSLPTLPSFSLESRTSLQSFSLSNIQQSLHADPSFVLTSTLLLSMFGVFLERKTLIGKALSAPLATMALALVVANLGIVPFSSPIYSVINSFMIPLAVPMLLFDSDLQRIVQDTGSLLLAFGVGAIATIVGTLVAYPLLLKGKGLYAVACALAARHIGGAINFVAVAETLQISGSMVSAAIAADNVVVALYFAFLFAISANGEEGVDDEGEVDTTGTNELTDPEDVTSNADSSSSITLPTLGLAISTSSLLVTIGRFLTKLILPAGTSSLPLTSVLTVIGATAFPKFFSKIRTAGTALGILLIQLFFAASGAAGNLGLVLRSAPALFVFSALQIGIHFVTLIGLGRFILKLPPNELYLASNANVGGPTTAAAMAQAKEWPRLVLPALLIGILGYATATAIALALVPILR